MRMAPTKILAEREREKEKGKYGGVYLCFYVLL